MRREDVYAKIGELTILCATLEHRLQSLLKILIGQDNELVGPFFIHDLNLFVLLRKIRPVARYRLEDNPELLGDLLHTLKRIDAIRDLRNLLVHGEWHIEEDCETCPVRVRDFKMKHEEGQWQELSETTFDGNKLTALIERLQGTSRAVDDLIDRLHAWQGAPAGEAPPAADGD